MTLKSRILVDNKKKKNSWTKLDIRLLVRSIQIYIYIYIYFTNCKQTSTKFFFAIILGSTMCETPRKSNFLENGKMTISVKIQNFFRSRMTKQTSPLELSHEI